MLLILIVVIALAFDFTNGFHQGPTLWCGQPHVVGFRSAEPFKCSTNAGRTRHAIRYCRLRLAAAEHRVEEGAYG
jgi:hypothetical protein